MNRVEIYELAKALCDQPWDSIGSLEGPVNANVGKNGIIDQLVSILTLRLDILNATRRYPSRMLCTLIPSILEGRVCGNTSIVDTDVQKELRQYVTKICESYNEVPYHSMYHAHHVTISMNKLICMLIEEEKGAMSLSMSSQYGRRSSDNYMKNGRVNESTSLTLGIGNDAFTHFCLLFACLIHDVGHKGVSNMQLAKEGDELSLLYNDQSTAEQNSITTSMLLLYKPEYKNLLNCIATKVDLRRQFRAKLIQIVMHTDIASPDRTQLAKSRWKEAFESKRNLPPNAALAQKGLSSSCLINTRGKNSLNPRVQMNRTASTIIHSVTTNRPVVKFGIRRALQLNGEVIDFYSDEDENALKVSTVLEQMMSVADIAHMFQNFSVMSKWNERLFHELCVANSQGRGFNPEPNWFKGQITFIDNVVMPLADRVSICHVFGENSFLFLKNVQELRRRWIVDGFVFCDSIAMKYSTIHEMDDDDDDEDD